MQSSLYVISFVSVASYYTQGQSATIMKLQKRDSADAENVRLTTT